jgi:3,4-dihydroxy 2-butanone 4-phosphate synthase / GTP cyclohydrolase II
MSEALTARLSEAIEAYRAGKMVVIVDDEHRENEGDIAVACERITAEDINFMVRYGRGQITTPVAPERLDALKLPLQDPTAVDWIRPAMTVTVDLAHGITTGASAQDRAATMRALADPSFTADDLIRPGHVAPLRGRAGGVLRRTGHTEASIDLARMAGLFPCAAICEVLKEDGSMARLPELVELAREHDMPIVTVEELVAHRRRTEKLVRRTTQAHLPTRHGEFELFAYDTDVQTAPFLALVKGDVATDDPVLVRVHSGCLTGDVFGSLRCDCGDQLGVAMDRIEAEGRGVILYVPGHEGRGIGLGPKLCAYELQDKGADTVEANELLGYPADLRDYGLGVQVLLDLGLRRVRLLTNNPKKLIALQGYGLEVVEQVSIEVPPRDENRRYLTTKRDKLGHTLTLGEE